MIKEYVFGIYVKDGNTFKKITEFKYEHLAKMFVEASTDKTAHIVEEG